MTGAATVAPAAPDASVNGAASVAPAGSTGGAAPVAPAALPVAPVNSSQVLDTGSKTGPRFVVVLVSVVLILQLASLATMGVTLHESELRSDEIAALSAKVDETTRTISTPSLLHPDSPVGPISSVKPSNKSRPHVIMAMDIDYPPYAYIRKPPYENSHALDEVVGVWVPT